MTVPTASQTPPARKRRGPFGQIMLLLGGLGLLLIVAGVLLAARSLFIVVGQPVVTGTIAQIDTIEADSAAPAGSVDSKVQFVPIIQYRVGDQSYKIKGQSANKYTTYQVGQVVSVRYNPQHPEQGQVDSFQAPWLGPIALIILGLPLAYIARAALPSWGQFRRQRPIPTA